VQTEHLASTTTGEGEQPDRGDRRGIYPILNYRIEGCA
jgi:hypothetical protein